MITKKRARIYAALAVAFVILTFGWASHAHEEKAGVTEIRVSVSKFWTAPPLFVGMDQGLFNRPGIKVTWHEFVAPPQGLQAMIAGSIDAAVNTEPEYIMARARGVKVSAVALLMGWSVPTSTWFVRSDSRIRRIADLKGKVIAISNFAGNYDLYLRYMMEKHGLKWQVDATVVEMPIPATLGALMAGKIDGGVVPPLIVKLAQLKFKNKLRPLFSYEDVDIIKKGHLNTMILTMSKDMIVNHRKAAKTFLRGYLEAVRFIRKKPKQALEAWAKAAGVPLVKQMDEPFYFPPDGKLDLAALQVPADLLYRYGYIKKKFKARDLVDHSLIDEILAGN